VGGNTLNGSVFTVWNEWGRTNMNVSCGLGACRKANSLKIHAQMKSNIERELQYDGKTWVVGCCEQGNEHLDLLEFRIFLEYLSKYCLLKNKKSVYGIEGFASYITVFTMCLQCMPHTT
jgi:hypothetical protein